jgi:hypothetical protein
MQREAVINIAGLLQTGNIGIPRLRWFLSQISSSNDTSSGVVPAKSIVSSSGDLTSGISGASTSYVYLIVAGVLGALVFVLLVVVVALLVRSRLGRKRAQALVKAPGVEGEKWKPVSMSNPMLVRKSSSVSKLLEVAAVGGASGAQLVVPRMPLVPQIEYQQPVQPKRPQRYLPLPDGWEVMVEESTGERYYASMYTDETQWERPTAPARKSANATLPAGWVEEIDESSGDVYYASEVTDETTWERPTAPPKRRGGRSVANEW